MKVRNVENDEKLAGETLNDQEFEALSCVSMQHKVTVTDLEPVSCAGTLP